MDMIPVFTEDPTLKSRTDLPTQVCLAVCTCRISQRRLPNTVRCICVHTHTSKRADELEGRRDYLIPISVL